MLLRLALERRGNIFLHERFQFGFFSSRLGFKVEASSDSKAPPKVYGLRYGGNCDEEIGSRRF